MREKILRRLYNKNKDFFISLMWEEFSKSPDKNCEDYTSKIVARKDGLYLLNYGVVWDKKEPELKLEKTKIKT